jgi:hypothetical protein
MLKQNALKLTAKQLLRYKNGMKTMPSLDHFRVTVNIRKQDFSMTKLGKCSSFVDRKPLEDMRCLIWVAGNI